jgi:DNA-binding GntR family transcriptional regulator
MGLNQLQRVGLVWVGDTGRAFVSRLTREDLEELYAVRKGLEGLAARLGAAAVAENDLARMRALLTKLQRLARRQDVEGYLRERWVFHATCYAAAERPRLLSEVERLFWRAERYNRLILSRPEAFRGSIHYYRLFYNACKAADGGSAEDVMAESMHWAVDLIWNALPSERQ